MRTEILPLGALSLACACAWGGARTAALDRPPAPAPKAAAASEAPPVPPGEGKVILRMQMRNKSVVIRTGPGGPRYFVTMDSGEVLADGLSADEMQAAQPKLFDALQMLFADDGRSEVFFVPARKE